MWDPQNNGFQYVSIQKLSNFGWFGLGYPHFRTPTFLESVFAG